MRVSSNLAIVGSAQFGLSGPYDCHVYAIRAPGGIVLVDAGSGLHEEEILANLQQDFPQENLAAILVTHAHMDHSGGVPGLRHHFGCKTYASEISAPVFASADEERNGLRRARQSGIYPGGIHMTPWTPDQIYRDGEPVEIAGLSILPLHVRGHADDIYCLSTEIDGRRACFSSDVVFYGGVLGVINAPDSGMQGYRKDLPKLDGLDTEYLLPGHGMFTLKNGQRHIDHAVKSLRNGFLPPQIGQGVDIF